MAQLALRTADEVLSIQKSLKRFRNGQEAPVIIALREPESLRAERFNLDALQQDVRQSQESVLNGLTASELRIRRQFQSVPGFSAHILTMEGLNKLLQNELVTRIGLDRQGQGGLEDSVPLIGANTWHDSNVLGDGIVVAVLDSGIDTDHPD